MHASAFRASLHDASSLESCVHSRRDRLAALQAPNTYRGLVAGFEKNAVGQRRYASHGQRRTVALHSRCQHPAHRTAKQRCANSTASLFSACVSCGAAPLRTTHRIGSTQSRAMRFGWP